VVHSNGLDRLFGGNRIFWVKGMNIFGVFSSFFESIDWW